MWGGQGSLGLVCSSVNSTGGMIVGAVVGEGSGSWTAQGALASPPLAGGRGNLRARLQSLAEWLNDQVDAKWPVALFAVSNAWPRGINVTVPGSGVQP